MSVKQWIIKPQSRTRITCVEESFGEIRIGYTTPDEGKIPLSIIRRAMEFIPTPFSNHSGDLYLKDNKSWYWFCQTDKGDEFMCLYWGDLSTDSILKDPKTRRDRVFATEKQLVFKEQALEILDRLPDNDYCWIGTYEPSITDNYTLAFKPGEKVDSEWLLGDLASKANSYSWENWSGIGSDQIYIILLLRLLQDGFLTIEQIADDSSEIGNYATSSDSNHELEMVGSRLVAGISLCGNTSRVVRDSKTGALCLAGGSCWDSGKDYPAARIEPIPESDIAKKLEDITPFVVFPPI